MIHSNRILNRYNQTLTCINPTGSLVGGKWVADLTGVTFAIKAMVQPIRTSDTKWLPDGANIVDLRVIICSRQLQATDNKLQQDGTMILDYLGTNWFVLSKTEHGTGNRHNRYVIQRMRVGR